MQRGRRRQAPSVIAESLQPVIDEILQTATREDWSAVAGQAAAVGQDVTGWTARAALVVDRPLARAHLRQLALPVSTDPDDLMVVLKRAIAIATERFERREQDMQASRLEADELRERYATVLREAATAGGVFGAVDVVPELTSTGIRYAVRLALLSPFDLNQATSVFNGQGEELAGTSHQDGKIVFEAFDLEGAALHRLGEAIRNSESVILHYCRFAAEKELERQQLARRIENLLEAPADRETG